MSDRLAVTGTVAKFMSLSCGSTRYMIDVPHEHDQAAMHSVGLQVAVAALAAGSGSPSPSTGEKPRRRFSQLPHTQQMALKCQDADFQRWLKVDSDEAAADILRKRFGVESRREITNTQWQAVLGKFDGWLAEQRYG